MTDADAVCSRCGDSGDDVKQRPHSTAEIGNPNNPSLCYECNLKVSR